MNEQKQVSNQQTQPVQTQEPVKKKKGKIKGFFRWLARHPKLLILFILVVAIAVGGPFFWLAIRDQMSIYSDTSKLGFEDIGEMATQSAYCTEISMTEANREFFGISIPFTQSKYIYHCLLKSVFEKNKGGDGHYAELFRKLRLFVNVYLAEKYVVPLFRNLVDNGGEHSARSAP